MALSFVRSVFSVLAYIVTDDTSWILLDTETTGFAKPIFAVDLAAQKMRGWEPVGPPFRRLLNHGRTIPQEASRVHGYTKEILERDGAPPLDVYRDFEAYAGGLPLVAYNLSYDWDQVLEPEWQRLGIDPIGFPGFCALKLTQRLLDPTPAGNCKLQTLRQYYRLPENGAHTALGDVLTVIDLIRDVLRPLAETRGLDTWARLLAFTRETWYPSRLSFGKYKGRLYQEASNEEGMLSWLEWLADSSNEKSSAMGRWYLDQLDSGGATNDAAMLDFRRQQESGVIPGNLVVFQDPELEVYRTLVESSRLRLADLESEFGVERAKVDTVRSKLFHALRPFYQERDRLRLVIRHRQAFIDKLLAEGEEAAESAAHDYERESADTDREYDSTASALEGKHELDGEEAEKLKQLWRKLVRTFHPDHHEADPEKRRTYELLTQAINQARDNGDIDLLELIARNPEAFILKQGWAQVSLDGGAELGELRALYEHLQAQIFEMIETLEEIRNSSDHKIFRAAETDPELLTRIIEAQREQLDREIEDLRVIASKVAEEAEQLAGTVPF